MDVVTKSVETGIRPIESDNPNGEFEVVLSTEALDRDGEHLWIDEWKQPLPARIHIDGDHGMTIEKTVGSVVPRIEGNQLIGKGTFAPTPYAQMVRQIVNDKDAEGHAIAMSVTFAQKKNQKDGKPQRELLNAAFVAVPANPEAVVLSSKSADIVTKDDGAGAGIAASGNNPVAPDSGAHTGHPQSIHDAAVALGAQCFGEIEAESIASALGDKGINTETSDTKDVGAPQDDESESAAAETAEKSAVSAAADDDSAARAKQFLLAKSRALQFTIPDEITS